MSELRIDPTLDDLTPEQLRAVMPRCDVATWHPLLVAAMAPRGIVTPARVCAVLAQVAHESGELRRLEEVLSYTAERLMQVWPKRFPTLESATPYARAPEALANHVYANRLGNDGAGDGWRYRGGGLIMLTGRANHAEAAEGTGLGLVEHPEILRTPGPAPAVTACWFWQSKGCNELADATTGSMPEDAFRKLTRRINGGLTGLTERMAYWTKAKEVIS